jgi:hypothetical protein
VVVLGLGYAVSRWRESRAEQPQGIPSTAVPAQASAGPAALFSATGAGTEANARFADGAAEAGLDASADADGGVDATGGDAAGAGLPYEVDFAEPPWFLEHRTIDHGVGICGGEETTEFPRLRFESDGGARVLDLQSIDDSCPHGTSRTRTVQKMFDYDGDGSPELLVVTQTTYGSGLVGEESNIWTVRGTDIQVFRMEAGPAPSFTDVDDVDADGRPDLISRGTFTDSVVTMSCGTGFVTAPIFLHHSLPGGGFSMRDAVARKFLDDACGSDSLEGVLGGTTEFGKELGTAVACARAHGATAEAVTRTLRKLCATFSEDSCDAAQNDAGRLSICPAWALTLAKDEPPR